MGINSTFKYTETTVNTQTLEFTPRFSFIGPYPCMDPQGAWMKYTDWEEISDVEMIRWSVVDGYPTMDPQGAWIKYDEADELFGYC